MNQYLYRIQPTRWEMLTEGATPFEQEKIGEHFAYLEKLVQRGVALLAGRTQSPSRDGMGIVIFRAADDMAARKIVDEDPAVEAGAFAAQLFPFRVALLARDHTPWLPE
ncbi:MAG: hypothetical protein HPY76_09910 [Anaerolineae bacterium]|jgi:uncharacterized protein YciI|nr:hypothetical protein [Anaerolineae bacterium]